MIRIVTVRTPSLGDRSYLATDGSVALVIDPQRDIDRFLAAAGGAAVTHVFETHIHNDYLTGGLALSRATGAGYHVNGADRVAFSRIPVGDGDVIEVGPAMRIRVVATPGHTFTHLAYVLEDAAGAAIAVFSGGSLLHGSTGRTDLLGARHARALAAAQHASARRLAAGLPDSAELYPTHGFGSFCAATAATADMSTIGDQQRSNPALLLSQAEYVTGLLAGLDDYPAYYRRMAPANTTGPRAALLAPPAAVGPGQVAQRIAAGEWVVDLRDRRAFAAAHLPGSLSFEYGDSFTSHLGWLLPPGTPLTLVGDSPGQIAAAQRDLMRIGVDRIAGAACHPASRDDPASWDAVAGRDGADGPEAADGKPASYPVSDFAGLAAARRDREVIVLDVRRRLEWAERHISGALHVPLHHLPARLPDLPPGPVWVHCQAGYRASVAASLLHAAGRAVTAVDDDFGRAALAGLLLEPASPGRRASQPIAGQAAAGSLSR